METLYCVACAKEVEAQALFGDSIYPHRPDLYGKTFLQCPLCGNYVGTHQDGRPLGTIPTPELRAMRNKVHAVIDEYWLPECNRGKRKRLYKALSIFLGREYHTGELNSIEAQYNHNRTTHPVVPLCLREGTIGVGVTYNVTFNETTYNET